jgi:hypothetical protein
VNLKDINAFALPGGAMFVQRGMFDAAGRRNAGRLRRSRNGISTDGPGPSPPRRGRHVLRAHVA